MNPDDLADFREDCINLLRLLQKFELSSEYSDEVIGTVFYKVAAMKAIRTGVSLHQFLEFGDYFYLTIEQMVRDSDNELLNDSKKENQNGHEG